MARPALEAAVVLDSFTTKEGLTAIYTHIHTYGQSCLVQSGTARHQNIQWQ